MFVRHGHAEDDKYGLDILKPLSKEGQQQADKAKLPAKIDNVIYSPALRTIQTTNFLLHADGIHRGMNPLRIIHKPLSELYAPILVPEMDEMYAEHKSNSRAYLSDKRAKTMLALIKDTAGIIPKDVPNLLITGHSVISNLLAYYMFKKEEVLDIEMGYAKGFAIENKIEIIQF